MSGSASGLVPNLSLGAVVPSPQGGAAPLSPFDALAKMGQIRAQGNQAQQFQQTFAAKQRAGEIMAQAPDMEAGLAAMAKDPLVAGFAGDVINTARQTQHTMEQYQGQALKNNTDAVKGVLMGAAMAARDPASLDKALNAGLQGVPETLRARMLPAVAAFRNALTDGLPTGPQGTAMYQARLTGLLTSSGMSSDAIGANLGVGGNMDVGNAKVPTVTLPGVGQVPSGAPGTPIGLGPERRETEGPDGAKRLQEFGPVAGADAGKTGGGVLAGPVVRVGPIGAGGEVTAGNPLTAPVAGVGNPSGATAAPTPAAPSGGLGNPPATRTLSTGATPGTVASQRNVAETDSEVERRILGRSAGMQQNVKDLDMMTDALQKFQAGGGANARRELGRFMEGLKNIGLPVTQQQIDSVANESLEGSQLFNKVVGGVVLRKLGEDTKGQGQTRMPEINMALGSVNADITPDALVKMLNNLRQTYAVNFDKALKLPMYRGMVEAAEKGGDVPGLPSGYKMRDFETWYDNNYNPGNLPGANAGGGIRLAPVDPASVQGTRENAAAKAAPRATRRFNRESGKFEDIAQ